MQYLVQFGNNPFKQNQFKTRQYKSNTEKINAIQTKPGHHKATNLLFKRLSKYSRRPVISISRSDIRFNKTAQCLVSLITVFKQSLPFRPGIGQIRLQKTLSHSGHRCL